MKPFDQFNIYQIEATNCWAIHLDDLIGGLGEYHDGVYQLTLLFVKLQLYLREYVKWFVRFVTLTMFCPDLLENVKIADYNSCLN